MIFHVLSNFKCYALLRENNRSLNSEHWVLNKNSTYSDRRQITAVDGIKNILTFDP